MSAGDAGPRRRPWETPPTLLELLEVVLAPLYFHALFFNRPATADHARALVDRLLTLAKLRRAEPTTPPT